jgi:hypothetical protein
VTVKNSTNINKTMNTSHLNSLNTNNTTTFHLDCMRSRFNMLDINSLLQSIIRRFEYINSITKFIKINAFFLYILLQFIVKKIFVLSCSTWKIYILTDGLNLLFYFIFNIYYQNKWGIFSMRISKKIPTLFSLFFQWNFLMKMYEKHFLCLHHYHKFIFNNRCIIHKDKCFFSLHTFTIHCQKDFCTVMFNLKNIYIDRRFYTPVIKYEFMIMM